jgi:predicted transcriptional regulator of viral defense system
MPTIRYEASLTFTTPAKVGTASVFRTHELEAQGISRPRIRELASSGLLQKIGRGLYAKPDAAVEENHALAEVGKRVPKGAVCLLSALRFHNLTTQVPREIWVALDRKARHPKVDYLPLRVVWFSGAALQEGQEQHVVEGVPVRIYNPGKTVADCFKYRNKIGLDVALEALREAWRKRSCTMSELTHYARICRVSNVMRPYLESLP